MASIIGSAAPGLLIAPPPLTDPNFDRTVVLVAVHDEAGAFGLVLNRAGPVSLGELFELAGYGSGLRHHGSPVWSGGPVQANSGWVLSIGAGAAPDGTILVGENIRISSARSTLDLLARDLEHRAPGEPDPERRTVLLGYSGWGPGQLDAELAMGAWLPVPLDEEIVFDTDLDAKWERAYAKLGLSPVSFLSLRRGGSA